ncbi:hypothetical protein HK103_007465 [Boothiomyces macroporosus]|uniref:NAD(P)-binding protein n=1 Tax=Boothiomyces macroporosus TaxID=261099 RepID=A0AAD5UC35_9FUNG|nr:hypothetical protein HK103_007465 [Boothiomyces macroporosus]
MPPNPKNFSAASIPTLNNLVYIVTGGNTGIGYITCLELARKGALVYMASRSRDRGMAAIEKIKKETGKNVEFLQLDLQDLKQVQQAAKDFLKLDKPVDCLVNNAGIMACPFSLTKDGIESQFGTNHVGHFLFTKELMPAILKANNPRIVNVSSSYHNKAPLPEGIRFDHINDEKNMNNWQRYGQSKLANILFTRGLHKRFGDKVYCNVIHPGFVDTELIRGPVESAGVFAPVLSFVLKGVKMAVALTPDQGALTQLYCATSEDIEKENIRNKFFVPIASMVEPELEDLASDEKLADQLWEYSENLVKEKLGLE